LEAVFGILKFARTRIFVQALFFPSTRIYIYIFLLVLEGLR